MRELVIIVSILRPGEVRLLLNCNSSGANARWRGDAFARVVATGLRSVGPCLPPRRLRPESGRLRRGTSTGSQNQWQSVTWPEWAGGRRASQPEFCVRTRERISPRSRWMCGRHAV